jgi:hypothetical protein
VAVAVAVEVAVGLDFVIDISMEVSRTGCLEVGLAKVGDAGKEAVARDWGGMVAGD